MRNGGLSKRRRPTDWQSLYEERVAAPLYDAAGRVFSKVSDVTLDYDLGRIDVRVTERIDTEARNLLKAWLQEATKEFDSSGRKYKIRVHHPPVYPYTWHGLELGSVERQSTRQIVQFDFSIQELASLRVAYLELAARCVSFDYVLTFTRGGIPALNFITEQEFRRSSFSRSEGLLTDLQEKFHLFPGLSLRGAKNRLAGWLSLVKKPCSILVFDTGSEGNGARAALKFIKQSLLTGPPTPVKTVQILGLVDGKSPEQATNRELILTPQGINILFEIDYIRASSVLTEDCPMLLGYDYLRAKVGMAPIPNSAILRLSDEATGKCLIVGALSASRILSRFLSSPNGQELSPGESAVELNFPIIEGMLRASQFKHEEKQLESLRDLRLISKSTFHANLEALNKKYDAMDELPTVRGKIRSRTHR